MSAQTGDNIVQGASGTLDSSSFLDASAFTGTDFCARVYAALTATYPTTPRTIDARGLNSGNTTMTCASGSTPWLQGGVAITTQSIILLPAGTITINTNWVIPAQTEVIGEGARNTTILANSGFSGDMIDFGSSTSCSGQVFAIGLSHLMLNGNGQNINGVYNNCAGEQSYVNEVSIRYVEGTGLYLGSGATNSGPYRELSVSAGGSGCGSACNPTTTTACVRIVSASTRGIHGITCTSNGTPYAGIYVDGYNNTIEDAHFEGVVDGIVVGDAGVAPGNTILNITGAGGGSTSGPITNIVHVCSSTSGATPCSSSSGPVTDLSLIGITGSQAQFHTVYMVRDDETSTDIAAPTYPAQGYVGTYFLGEPIGSGYSRFVTNTGGSADTPTWGVGSTVPGSSCTGQNGSLFSNTGGTGTGLDTLYVCVAGTWTAIK